MKTIKTTLLLSALAVSLTACQSTGDSAKASDSNTTSATSIASMVGSLTGSVQAQQSSPIVEALTSQFGVSSEQATGGAGALLALASNSLSSSESSELSSLIPGLSSLQSSVPGLTSMANNMGAVSDIFSKLGLDPSMVTQFAPVILNYLTGQGASSGLLGSLSSLWGA